jgi:hypothetical protein
MYFSSTISTNTLSSTSPHTYLVTLGTGTHVQTTAPDGRVDFYTAEIVSSREYSAYGAELRGYSWDGELSYRYGFQSQEVDEEFWSGAVSYKYRIEGAGMGQIEEV